MSPEKPTMQIRLRLSPGQNGTKKLVEQYGDKLVCVRYRYDEATGKRYKTAEIIVGESAWSPATEHLPADNTRNPSERLGIRVGIGETDIRDRVKRAGGIWRPRHRLWELSYAQIVSLGLEDRIALE
jgi:hypothetical protein